MNQRSKKFPATRMVELEKERKELLEILKHEKEDKEKFADESYLRAKPEDIDKLFCSKEEPCSPTITLYTNMYLNEKALQDAAEEVAIDVLFCAPAQRTQVTFENKPVPLYPREQVVAEREKEQISLMSKQSYFQKIRKYLSEQWQQKISMLQRNSTGQRSN